MSCWWSAYSKQDIVYEREGEGKEEEEEFTEHKFDFDLKCEFHKKRRKETRRIKIAKKTRSIVKNLVKTQLTDEENESMKKLNVKNILESLSFAAVRTVGKSKLKKEILKSETLVINFTSQKKNKDEKLKRKNIQRHSKETVVIKEKKVKANQVLQLQYRDITPEDYEILLTLDDKVKKRTADKSFVENLCQINTKCQQKPHNELQYRDTTTEDNEILLTLDYSLQKELADISIIENLTQQKKFNDLVENCVICMADITYNDSFTVLPLCQHKFHRECISKWLLNCSRQCPIDMSYVH